MHIYKHKQTNLDNDDKAKRWQIVLGQYCVSHPSLSKSFIHTVSIVFVLMEQVFFDLFGAYFQVFE